jgi:hypothetical protein
MAQRAAAGLPKLRFDSITTAKKSLRIRAAEPLSAEPVLGGNHVKTNT